MDDEHPATSVAVIREERTLFIGKNAEIMLPRRSIDYLIESFRALPATNAGTFAAAI